MIAITELLSVVALQDDCSDAWRSVVITMNSSSNIISRSVNVCWLMSSLFSISLDTVTYCFACCANEQATDISDV